MIPIAQPLTGEEEAEAVLAVLRSGRLAQGEQVAAFEQRFAEFCQVREAVAVSSGTAALYLALLAHEIGPGDEVITTPFSFVATSNTILQTGATPVFVDIDPVTCNINPELVEAAITRCTKAILPVHLYGNPCDMEKLETLATEHNLYLIEDACQAHGACINGKAVGSFGTGCFSFYPTKNMTTGEGGMITTNDPLIAQRLRLLRSHGEPKRYTHIMMGFNLRMTEIQAALGLVQLKKLKQFNEARIAHAAYLTRHLGSLIQTPVVQKGYHHVFHQYTIRVPYGHDRDEWVRRLGERGVTAAIYYPHPLHLQPFYRNAPELFRIAGKAASGPPAFRAARLAGGERTAPVIETEPDLDELWSRQLPEVEKAAQEVLSLPVHPALTENDMAIIVREVLNLCV
ncbi:MAG TPA: DegT/DnrJ/EryC1/StrS family aminotransferase [Ktedonosporobacter sp.]|jgi:dTDP-4-amino-4,6-dideoxygalactose transaminase|nr:DegT/DnrJ/EryC1/StrS family aminotransferase [Ktedonosporobacter sp.]